MTWDQFFEKLFSIQEYVFPIVTAFGALAFGARLRMHHAEHVSLICYLFSLALCITVGLVKFLDLDVYLTPVKSLDGSVETALAYVIRETLNVRAELILVALLFFLSVVPQIISYFLSGIFGCASVPKFVFFVSRAVGWSLCKFCAFGSGIFAGLAIMTLAGLMPSSDNYGPKSLIGLSNSGLSAAFFLAVAIEEILQGIVTFRDRLPILRTVDSFMRRHISD